MDFGGDGAEAGDEGLVGEFDDDGEEGDDEGFDEEDEAALQEAEDYDPTFVTGGVPWCARCTWRGL